VTKTVGRTLRVLLWTLSAGIWIFSAFLDGRFLREMMPFGALGTIAGYGLNFAADVTSEMFAYLFARLQRSNRRGSKLWRWSFALLPLEVGALYYSTVFSWATVRSVAGSLEPWLQWSVATFAGFFLLGLGLGQALLDVRIESEKVSQESEPVAQAPRYACDRCDFVGENQNALNAHRGWHKRNGAKAQREREEVQDAS